MGGSLAHFFFMLRVVAPFDRHEFAARMTSHARPRRPLRTAVGDHHTQVAADEVIS
jgi:hypothetical protein